MVNINDQVSGEERLRQIKSRLVEVYGSHLQGLILYGSEARNEATPDSDIDMLVLLEGPFDYGREISTILNAVYALSLKFGRRISAKPVDASEYESVDCPLYSIAHREGVAV